MKKILFFLLVLASFTLSAQNEQMREMMRTTQPSRNVTDVPAENIQFWVGSGSNEVVAAFFFCNNPAVGIAYGYRFNGTATIVDMCNAIHAADPNFTFTTSGNFFNTIAYNNGTLSCSITGGMMMYTVSGNYVSGNSDPLVNGDYFELCEWGDCTLPTTNIYYPVDPSAPTAPEDASIAASDIVYWVGNGNNEVVFSVVWADSALAWGYRFSEDSVMVMDIMDSISANDWRFSYTGAGFISDIIYADSTTTLNLSSHIGNYFNMGVNHEASMIGVTQKVVDGDFVKFADTYAGVVVDSTWYSDWGGYWDYTYVWPQTIYPVSVPPVQDTTPVTPELPEDASIAAGDIIYWVGNGNNEVVFSVVWADSALAWGYRFSEDSTTVLTVMDSIAAHDWRFSYTGAGFISDIIYADSTTTLNLSSHIGNYFNLGVNHVASWVGVEHVLVNGDFVKFADTYAGVVVDSTWYSDWGGYWDYTYVWPQTIYPVSIPESGEEDSQDATISADNIIYWVGNGDNEVVFAVNWCTPEEEALAWGVRFSGENAIVADIMHTIELYDSRITFEGAGYVTNITFADGIHDNYTPSMYWMYNVNSVGAMLGIDQQTVQDGDIIKFGDSGCGIDDGNWNYVWTTPIQPVELPAASTEVFDGIVTSAGCQAIKFDNEAILGWATTCVVTRGYQNIEQAGALASYGTDNDAVGPADSATTDAMVSLGDGGYAVLTFGMPISNGEGYDFAVFENALNHTFLELAFVEVSSDGEHFYRFPSVSNTQTDQQIGNGGAVDATKLHNLAGKYKAGWGTPFDLEELAGYSNLDINNVTHVRIVDVVGSINPLYGTTDKNGHLINDPYPTPFNSSGFDLSGVAVMNGWTPSAVNDYQQQVSFVAYPNPCQNVLNVNNVMVNEPVSLFNAMGQQIWSGMTQDTYFQLDMQSYPAGIYMLQIGAQMTKIVKK